MKRAKYELAYEFAYMLEDSKIYKVDNVQSRIRIEVIDNRDKRERERDICVRDRGMYKVELKKCAYF